MQPGHIRREIEEQLRRLDFDAVGFTRPDSIHHASGRFRQFLADNHHGTMDWMERRAEWREDPQKLWPEAKTIVMAAMNYGPESDPLELLSQRENAAISVYARGRDYHDVLKKKLKRVAGWLHRESQAEVKVFVDTAPVLEKPLAQAAGLGWQGKHTNLVSQDFGSWLFLGSIFTTLELEPSAPEADHCGSCSACLDVCPTNAFPSPYRLDARKCISYLTIEHKGTIPRMFRAPMGNRIYGCDDCLAVCPWNKFARSAREAKFLAPDGMSSPLLEELVQLDDQSFRQKFSGSPIKRIGRDRFVRNVLIAVGNSNRTSFLPAVRQRLTDSSPLVRAMAVWACRCLMTREDFEDLKSEYVAKELSKDVLDEWGAEADAATDVSV